MSMSIELIAPCGVNCAVCIAYLRPKNKCTGCLTKQGSKVPHCSKCSIKLCSQHDEAEFIHCYECREFPCARMKKLDKRYREKYHVSVIDNLLKIKEIGLDAYVEKENDRWACKGCGAVLSVHREACLVCGTEKRGLQ